MALQVWLPLTKDLRQQGLASAYKVGSNTATLTTGGKFGGCYNFTATTGSGMLLNNDVTTFMNTYINNHSWSLCAWIKNSVDNGDTCVIALTYGLLLYGGSSTAVKLYNSARTITCTSSVGTGDNQWHHLVATYNVDTNAIKIYVDGINTGSATYTSGYTYASSWTNGLFIGRDPNNSTANAHYFYQGQINDVRIYDHCLSLMEVKELSKGLVLHYPLDRNTTYTSLIDKTANYNIYNNFSVTASLVATGENYLGSPVRRLSMTPDSSHLSNFQTALGSHGVYNWRRTFTASTKYVFWIYYKPVSHMDVRVGGTASNINGWTEIPPKAVGDGWYVVGQYRNGSVAEDKTDNIFVSFYSPTAETGTPIQIDFACPTLVQGLTEIQPSINYGDNSIVYDCSGYCNNATIINTLHTAIDTPKYQASTQFDTTSTKIKLPSMNFTGMANSYTFVWWQYNINTGNMPWGFSDGNRLNCYHTSPLCWNTGDGSNNQFKDGSTTIAPATVQNAWHHMAITGDGTSTKLYIDGVYRGTATTYKALTGTQIYISGWDTSTSYTFNGSKECDFRIYATALSADDVKSLYQNCATIGSDGTIYGQIRN